MASAVNELGQLLRGGEAPADANQQADGAGGSVQPGAAAAAAGKAGATGVDISKLSQLSDFADKELQRDQKPAHFSQESLIEPPPNPLTFQQASQPADIPAPLLPESQNMSTLPPGATPASAAAAAAAEEQQKQMAAAAAAAVGGVLPMEQMMALMPGMLGMDWAQMAVPHTMEADVSEQPGPRSKSGKPTRRGPMDEMRQLVRILVKLLPQSIAYIGANEEAGGGNRISEEQIKNYLEKTLGDAPRPPWGVPNGWYSYVSELFSWALGRPVDEESTKKCAKREPGRSWEALDSELQAIGVHPHCWPLPLSLMGVREAEKNPIPQPIPQLPTVKRGAEGEAVVRRGRSGASATLDLDRLSEYDAWKHLCDVLAVATSKANTTPPEMQQALAGLKSQAKGQIDVLTGGVGGLNMLQYVPVMGLDGNPSMMAFLGGMQGMSMGLPPVTGQLVGADGQLIAADGATAAAAAAAAAHAVAAGEAAMAAPAPGSAGGEPAAKRARREGEEGGGDSPQEDEGRAADKGKAPLSSSEARGTLFGALGGADAGGDAARQQQLAQQAQQLGQLPLLYAAQPGAPAFMMPPGFPGLVPGAAAGFPAAEGAPATAEGAPATAEGAPAPAPAPTGEA
ncbi:hypothetical protein CHLNCDRAFT_142040 [Chlorella variabilis]|uniref:Uncharacterized protein n=1 Tax=Chlorella variabilis TaxID=554065 RepID=E1Z7L8_CHLVA|nr:hypothetical protein CHLNCDRAFT_142040 [Chlorella variabilis]EFN58193.1 hypothetical protein CHLNCDRAFT_142040 [Chlorella variabilis]|eukprot:XP_005850295.1 hypothetical protein CHLNCDRAFT_142040 [Chlorella variabilis]